MSDPSKKSSRTLISLAAAIVVAAGVFFGVSWWEKDLARQIEEAVASSSGSVASIKVGFWDKSAVITGLKISRADLPLPFTLEIDSLSLSGVNSGALSAKGVVPLADAVAMNKVRMLFAPLEARSDSPLELQKREISIASGVLTGVRGDLASLAELGRDTSGKKFDLDELERNPRPLLRSLALAKDLHADSLSFFGYEDRLSISSLPAPIVTTVESQRVKDFSLLAHGSSAWKNLKISVMGKDICTIESMGMQGVSIPDVITPLLSALPADGREPENMDALLGQVLRKQLERESFVMRGIAIDNLSFRGLSSDEAVTLKSLFLDLEAGAEKITLKNSFDGLVVPSLYYRDSGEIGALIARNHDALHVSGHADLLGSQKNGRIDLQVQDAGLTEKDFGSITANAALLADAPGADALEEFLQASLDWKVKNARLAFEDRRILELAFTAQYEMLQALGDQSPFKSVADVRASTARELRQAAADTPNPDMKAVLEGMARLAQQPGVLVVSLNPEAPQPLADIFDGMEASAPGVYKAAVEYAPAGENARQTPPQPPAGQ